MLIKFEPLFLAGRRRVLVLDSDIVFCGPILATLDRVQTDFVVAEEYWHGPLSGNYYGPRVVEALFFDTAKLRDLDPDYVFPGKAFNGGQMVITTGLLRREDFSPLIEWKGVPRLKRLDVFKSGDQGIWNYLLHQRSRLGQLTLQYADFMVFQDDSRCDTVDVRRLQNRQGFPFLIHWAGRHPPLLSSMNASEVLRFYDDYYYSMVPVSRLKRCWRAAGYTAGRVQKLSQHKMRMALHHILANLGLLALARRFERAFRGKPSS